MYHVSYSYSATCELASTLERRDLYFLFHFFKSFFFFPFTPPFRRVLTAEDSLACPPVVRHEPDTSCAPLYLSSSGLFIIDKWLFIEISVQHSEPRHRTAVTARKRLTVLVIYGFKHLPIYGSTDL